MFWKKLDESQMVFFKILFVNFGVAVIQIAFGQITGAVSIFAKGLHSLTDGLTNIWGILFLGWTKKSPDEKHPLGHRKIEYLGLAIIFLLMGGVLVKVILDAWQRFQRPQMPVIESSAFVFLGFCIIASAIAASYQHRRGVKLSCELLQGDAKHTFLDVLINIALMAGILLMRSGAPAIIDPIINLLVAVVIVWTMYGLAKKIKPVLLDEKMIDPNHIKQLVGGDCDKIVSFGTPKNISLQFCLFLEPELALSEIEATTSEIKEKIFEAIPEVNDIIIEVRSKKNCQ